MCILCLALAPAPSFAFTWQDLWYTPDQQGAKAMDANNPAEAATRFEDSKWRATAAYRAGKYALAAKLWQQTATDDADSAYNAGNAYAKQQQFQKAKQSYQNTLRLDPEHTDAKVNLRLIDKLLQKQQQQRRQQEDSSAEKNSASQSPNKPKEDQKTQQEKTNNEQQLNQASPAERQSQHHQASSANQEQLSQYPTLNESPHDSSYQSWHGDPFHDDYPELPSDTDDRNAQLPEQQRHKQSHQKGQAEQKQASHSSNGIEGENKQSQTTQQQRLADTAHEEQAKMEQWLRKINNDPGELLRRKFLRQQARRNTP